MSACSTLCDPIDSSPPGFSVRGILQARIHRRTIQKNLHDPDNHDGVITDLEPDILECEVKWALESITTNKASGGGGAGARGACAAPAERSLQVTAGEKPAASRLSLSQGFTQCAECPPVGLSLLVEF